MGDQEFCPECGQWTLAVDELGRVEDEPATTRAERDALAAQVEAAHTQIADAQRLLLDLAAKLEYHNMASSDGPCRCCVPRIAEARRWPAPPEGAET